MQTKGCYPSYPLNWTVYVEEVKGDVSAVDK